MTNSINERQKHLQAFGTGVKSRISSRLGDVWWAFMLRGVCAGALGICALVWPTLSLTILIRLIGIYCLVDGLAGLVGALRTSDRGAYLLQALVGLVVGGVLIFWPGTSIRTLLIVFGAWALFTGISQILAVRQAEADDARNPMMVLGATAAVIGLVLLLWPGTGVVAISWVIAIAALLLAGLLIFVAQRLKRLKTKVDHF